MNPALEIKGNSVKNTQCVLAKRPVGDIKDDDLQVREVSLDCTLENGEVLVRIEIVSLDPTHRVWMSDIDSYLPAVKLGAVMRAGGAGMNCIKIGLPGNLILGYYFQENRTSQRPFLLQRISFPGRPIFIQLPPGGRRGPLRDRQVPPVQVQGEPQPQGQVEQDALLRVQGAQLREQLQNLCNLATLAWQYYERF